MCNCVDKPEDTDANNTAADESGLNKTYTVNNSMYYMDLTLNGFPAAGLVFDEWPPRDDQGNTGTEETAAEDSISIHTDTEVDDLDDCEEVLTASFQCAECGTQAPNKHSLQMHIQMKHREFQCHLCLAAFVTEEIMLKHIDEEHFYSCPICESTFLRSFEKRNHMLNSHMVNHKEQEEEDAGNESETLEESEFIENIERHSTLTRTVRFKFVGDVNDVITDLKKNKRRPRGSE